MPEEDLLRRIDAKLSALLAIKLDEYLRGTGVAKPRPRSVDRLLADAGLTPKQIGVLLGKTDRAVNLQLASERRAKVGRPRRRGAPHAATEVPPDEGEV